MSLKGKNALVTGSSRGIGRGIALSLAERGARVAIHYYRDQGAAQATLERIRELGSNGFLVQADVCRPDEVRRIFKQVRSEFGSLDIFVSNARTEAANGSEEKGAQEDCQRKPHPAFRSPLSWRSNHLPCHWTLIGTNTGQEGRAIGSGSPALRNGAWGRRPYWMRLNIDRQLEQGMSLARDVRYCSPSSSRT